MQSPPSGWVNSQSGAQQKELMAQGEAKLPLTDVAKAAVAMARRRAPPLLLAGGALQRGWGRLQGAPPWPLRRERPA